MGRRPRRVCRRRRWPKLRPRTCIEDFCHAFLKRQTMLRYLVLIQFVLLPLLVIVAPTITSAQQIGPDTCRTRGQALSDPPPSPALDPAAGLQEARRRIIEAQSLGSAALDLSELNLSEVPAELFALSDLRQLKLNGNQL